MKMNPVIHFEMPAEDRKRMSNFYSNVFGWETNQLGPEMGDYVVVMTSETDKQTERPKNPGMIDGGFFQKSSDNQYPSVVIAVPDIREHKKKVIEAGGQFLGGQGAEFDEIPGIGLYASFIDTEGNRVGMLQPSVKIQD